MWMGSLPIAFARARLRSVVHADAFVNKGATAFYAARSKLSWHLRDARHAPYTLDEEISAKKLQALPTSNPSCVH